MVDVESRADSVYSALCRSHSKKKFKKKEKNGLVHRRPSTSKSSTFPKKKKNGFESTLETATLRSAHGSRRPNESKMRKKARSIETKEMSIDRERERERERDRPVA